MLPGKTFRAECRCIAISGTACVSLQGVNVGFRVQLASTICTVTADLQNPFKGATPLSISAMSVPRPGPSSTMRKPLGSPNFSHWSMHHTPTICRPICFSTLTELVRQSTASTRDMLPKYGQFMLLEGDWRRHSLKMMLGISPSVSRSARCGGRDRLYCGVLS